jgi:hypothetical protein
MAGGRSEGLPVSCKADLPVRGRPMTDWVAAALREVPEIGRVRVERGTEDGAKGLVGNLLRALERLEGAPPYVLLSACDIPFLTPEAVQDFLRRCEPGYDVYYPIVPRESCEARFPGVKRTYARLREGRFTGGNLFLIKPQVMPALAGPLERLFALRKSPFGLARELGIGVTFLGSALLGTLALRRVESTVETWAQIRPKAVISHFPEIGTDIDKWQDITLLDDRGLGLP